jgi:hypothetical protein
VLPNEALFPFAIASATLVEEVEERTDDEDDETASQVAGDI